MYLILYVILAVALMTDLKEDRIPNLLILTGLVTGVVMLILSDADWIEVLFQTMIVFFCLIPVYMIGALGGGDIKLLVLFPIFIGLELSINAIISSFMAAAICSVIKAVALLAAKKEIPIRKLTIHFSVPILIGTVLTVSGGLQWITI